MATYRKRPVDVEMVQWTGHNFGEVIDFVENEVVAANVPMVKNPIAEGRLPFWCAASQAEVTIPPGGWIAREVDGSGFYPLTEEAQRDGFERVYDDQAEHVALAADANRRMVDVSPATLIEFMLTAAGRDVKALTIQEAIDARAVIDRFEMF